MASILVVEDDEQVRTLAVTILQEAGHQTRSAASTTEADTIIRSDAQFDVLFVDFTLRDDTYGGPEIAMRASIWPKPPRAPVPAFASSTPRAEVSKRE